VHATSDAASFWPWTSVVLPAYREGPRIGRVLGVLRQLSGLARIVVVDDGSPDDTAAQARAFLRPQDRLLQLTANQGKAAALLHGVRSVDSPWVLFLDVDLVGLQPGHLEGLCAPVWHGEAHMSVAVLAERFAWLRAFRYWNGWLSGQRCMAREDAWRVLRAISGTGYGVELALSHHARRDGWSVASVLWPGVQHPRKTQKYGLMRGIGRYLRSLL